MFAFPHRLNLFSKKKTKHRNKTGPVYTPEGLCVSSLELSSQKIYRRVSDVYYLQGLLLFSSGPIYIHNNCVELLNFINAPHLPQNHSVFQESSLLSSMFQISVKDFFTQTPAPQPRSSPPSLSTQQPCYLQSTLPARQAENEL